MRPAPLIFALLLILPLVVADGALFGLRTREQCDQDPTMRPSQVIECYRAAAITYAFMQTPESRTEAVNTCRDIYTKFTSSSTDKKSDTDAEAAMKSNECFATVAKITRNPDVCTNIQKHGTVETGFTGEDVSRESCKAAAENLERLSPEKYYSDKNNTNICMMALVLPLVAVPALLIRK